MIPFDVAEGLLQEAMRESLTEYGLMKGTVDHLILSANDKLCALLAQLDEEP